MSATRNRGCGAEAPVVGDFGGLEAKPQPLNYFFNFSKKCLNAIWMTFRTFVGPVERTVKTRKRLNTSKLLSSFNPSNFLISSVARGGGYSPLISLSTKMQNKKNTTFLALLRLFFLRWNGLKSDLKHLLKHIFRGG